MSSALDPIQLVRGPTEPQCHLRCGSCSTIHALDGRVRTGGIPCPSCGEQLRTSDTVEYATPRERLAAAILDGVLWVAPYAAVTAPLFYVVAIGEFLPEDEDGDLTSNAVLAMRSLGVILAIAYFWLLEAIGKRPASAGVWCAFWARRLSSRPSGRSCCSPGAIHTGARCTTSSAAPTSYGADPATSQASE